MSPYFELKNLYLSEKSRLDLQFSRLSYSRVFVALAIIYLSYLFVNAHEPQYGAAAIILLAVFLWLMQKHQKVARERALNQQLIALNSEELDYLNGEIIPFQDGVENIDTKHLYAYDLDIFGPNSLYQHLNRTATHIGASHLARRLLSLLGHEEILENQAALQELQGQVEWRQKFLATARMTKDSKADYEKLLAWAQLPPDTFSKIQRLLYLVSPILLIVLILTYAVLGEQLYLSLASNVFVFNLILTMMQVRKIKSELIQSDRIAAIVKSYGYLFEELEGHAFNSKKLQNLQQQLKTEDGFVSAEVKRLGSLFTSMDSIQNGMAAVLFNGSILYHLHKLFALQKWKADNAARIAAWLDVVGEFETLNSLANFAQNNSEFCYPTLNNQFDIGFVNLGHPLIRREHRVGNDIKFTDHPFVILTGSNMSGKSTFLRTLGTNMVLAGIGAPVCASEALVHPLPVIVSMRQSDSLAEQESYFFAEVKRLKLIIDQLSAQRCFVLLDEILKGTNSDDKQTGTIEVIKKVVSQNAIGAIATHDLEVCKTTAEYPNQLVNLCFEVEIIQDELVFDYKLRPGICRNKSATFLMKKMQII